jgi:hypothetical protein
MKRAHQDDHVRRSRLVSSPLQPLILVLSAALSAAACGGHAGESTGKDHDAISGSAASIDNSNTVPSLAPVGRLQLFAGNCTGTLVSRTHVLAAGHCFTGNPQGSGTFVLPNGAPVPNDPANRSFNIASFTRVTNDDDDHPHDIAVAVLSTSVPASLVPTLPRVFSGDFITALFTGKMSGPGRMVGFGGTTPRASSNSQPPSDGNRRFGSTAGDFRVAMDSCGSFPFGIFEGHCNDDWEFEQERIANPQPEGGDSGGPLYLKDSSGNLVIVGVVAGIWEDDFNDPHTAWAPTWNPGGAKNGDFIVRRLGGDPDGDGILEVNDNCPATTCTGRGLDATDCKNPDQADADNDGIGEVCDNCPKALCDGFTTLPPNFSCRNASQNDKDGDGKGDTCDMCPETRFPNFGEVRLESDTDFDGVGEVCDGCPGPSPYATCRSDADCRGATCLIESSVSPVGHCSRLADRDNDSTPDSCDVCVNIPNRDLENSNATAESREQSLDGTVLNLPDACDPVPVVKVAAQRREFLDHVPVPGDGRDSDDVVTLDTTRWVGMDPTAPSRRVSTTRRTSFRHCSCVDSRTGAELGFTACVGAGLTCDWAQPATASQWKKITVVDQSMTQVMDSTGFTTPLSFFTALPMPQTLTWQWRRDATAGRIGTLGTCPGSGPTACRTHGVVFSGVQGGLLTTFSERDAGHALRDVFSMFDTPRFSSFVSRAPVIPPEMFGCIGLPGCIRVVPTIKNPFPNELSAAFDRPILINVTPSTVLGFLRPGVVVDFTSLYPASVRSVLARPARWLGAVESGRTIRARITSSPAVRLDAAMLARDFAGGAPIYVQTAAEGFRTFDPLAPEGGTPTTSVGGPVARLTGVAGVFSKIDQAIFMVGGKDPNGAPNKVIWRWNIPASRWDLALGTSKFLPSSTILGITYDSQRKSLYVLDVDDDDRTLTQKWARLVRYEMSTGASAEVLRVPYSGLYQTTSLAALEDGSIALVASTPLGYTAWQIDATGPNAAFIGVDVAPGLVLDTPLMGEDHLYLPVVRGTQLFQDELLSSSFVSGSPCSAL